MSAQPANPTAKSVIAQDLMRRATPTIRKTYAGTIYQFAARFSAGDSLVEIVMDELERG